jgi:trehalose synthase
MLDAQEVPLEPLSLARLGDVVPAREMGRLAAMLDPARARLRGRTFWHVNSTATGGGVAEMLPFLCGYLLGQDIQARWAVVQGNEPFFDLTKRIHNAIHAVPRTFTPDDREVYEDVLARNAETLLAWVKPGDVVFCHDPQTAGLVPALREAGAHVVWRSHIGHHVHEGSVADAWAFLAPYLKVAERLVFTRSAYVPPVLDGVDVTVVPPSVDPLAIKNRPVSPAQVGEILTSVGMLAGSPPDAPPTYLRSDGTTGSVVRSAQVLAEDGPPEPGTRLVVQVSRWDGLKDPIGVMRGFVEHVPTSGAALALAGPDVSGVTDDPEGAQVLADLREAWHALPAADRRRVYLFCLPMDDADENALMVNALQRHAAVVVQKSLYEGFGLTVTEAMWKARPLVASRVGGIQDQIEHRVHGLLLDDPHDLEGLGRACTELLEDEPFARGLGENARSRAAEHFLVTRHLRQWLEVATDLVG